ncbi:unnamed protein product [Candidula unifasciata]|uniref:ABC-type xenobiotic transporter n=1 Tax=Candidula unifasciata TaxID=100452 RepID=A0A8S4A0T7_9EUPU|nr:unnamed protein product [Candidula unifasciata]
MVAEELQREQLRIIGGSNAWNWSAFCGHGEDIQSWNENDFGHCFEQVAILAPSHTLLAIVSAYHFGRRKTTLGGNRLFVSWTWFLILRQVTVALLLVCPVFQVIFSVGTEHRPPSIAEGVVIGTSCFSWLLHSLFVWNLRYLHSDSLRGPASVLLCFLIVVAACVIHVHTVIMRHMSSGAPRSKAEEYTTYISAGLCLIYMISVVPNRRRIYRTSLAFQVNETDGETEPLTWDRIRSYNTVSVTNEHLTVAAEQNVGCLSWLTFHWVQNLMSRGAAMKISRVNDLYLLPERLNTHRVSAEFKEVLQDLEKEHNLEQTQVQNDDFISSMRNCADVPHTEVVSSSRALCGHETSVSDLQNSSSNPAHEEHHCESDSESVNSLTDDPTTDSSTVSRIGLFRALICAFGLEYFLLGILKFLADSCGFAGPILLNYLVSFIENASAQSKPYEGYLYAGGLFLSTLLSAIFSTQFDYNVQVVAYKIRCAVITTIYKKSLSVNSVSQSRFTSGEIVNFMSTDTDRILNFCPSFHAFWSLPFQVGVSLFLLYQQLGLAFLTGVAFAVLLIPINRWIAGKIGQLSTKMMKHKDERVKLTNELLSGIRVVKFYAWEQHFTARINSIREKELLYLRGRKYLDAMCVYFWATTPVMISILTFSTYVVMGKTLTAAKVFTSLSLFLMLISPLNAFPWVINGLVEAWVSLKRVHKFVCLEDTDPDHYYTSVAGNCSPVVWLKNASFTWTNSHCEDSDSITSVVEDSRNEGENSSPTPAAATRAQTQDLHDISLRIEKGQFVGIVGRVGSGKSSLLNALVGEMNKTQGEVFVDGLEEGFALVAQEPWVQQATVRDNILFGQPFNSQRYEQVLKACALVEDLKMMPSGDMTEIGENGITLSGGQRSRVALARAVYQDKSLYLLDDPLSAMDIHVAKHIYTHCIMGLLRSKTRVLCTHHVKFLKKADLVVVMEDGRITQSGLPRDVLPNIHLEDDHHEERNAKDSEECDATEEAEDKLIQEEERQTGSVKADVYKNYWKNVGVCLSPMVLMTMFFMQASRNTSDWWLSYWVSHSNSGSQNGSADVNSFLSSGQRDSLPLAHLTPAEDNLRFYLGIYGSLAGVNSIFTLARSFLFAYGGICAATVVHKRLLSAVLKAPLSFFETTPLGRIVNRFSSDLYAVDDSLPFTLNILLAQAYGMLGTLVITCYGLPWFAICLIPMGAVYFKIQHYYRRTSRELKRLSSISLSPIYAHFSGNNCRSGNHQGHEALREVLFRVQFCEENMQRLDINQRCQYATQLSARWIDFRLRMLGVAMVTSLSLIAVVQHHVSSVSAGLVGLAISYSLSVTSLLGGVVMFFTETEKEFVSMERCQFYIDHTPSEKWDGALFAPVAWPAEGVVEFDGVSLHYRDVQSPALNDVSFKTQPGEKIGIVGRTGAGKSSLFLALFRMVEVSSGRIIVDDVNIRLLDLSDIRSRFVAIPQDPFLFSGSVRMNLDPTGGHTDSELWSALDRCHLRSSIERMGGLEALLTQRGKEFSVGQRQLLCLARAMLTNAKIICIDEATASVDLETDALIQKTIRQEFKDSTVLTIAHRINTVLDSQRVLVMKDGMVAEFASPHDLLNDPSSMFYSFVYGSR